MNVNYWDHEEGFTPWVGADMLRIPQLCKLTYSQHVPCPELYCHALSTWEVPAVHAVTIVDMKGWLPLPVDSAFEYQYS